MDVDGLRSTSDRAGERDALERFLRLRLAAGDRDGGSYHPIEVLIPHLSLYVRD